MPVSVHSDIQSIGRREPCPCGGCPAPVPAGARPQWPQRTGPLPALARHRGVDRELLDLGWRPTWVDHPYRLRADDGRWCFVAEPYSLGDDALADLAALVAAGWQVRVSADEARHYPGHTIAVRITKEEES